MATREGGRSGEAISGLSAALLIAARQLTFEDSADRRDPTAPAKN